MKTLLILLAISFGILLYILLRFFIKRIHLRLSLMKFCKQNHFRCTFPFQCLLPLNHLKAFVQIETGSRIYQIKLFGLLRKHCEIHFWNLQEYSIQWYFIRAEYIGSPVPIGLTNTNRRRSLGDSNWATTPGITPVLLISPAQAPVRLTKTDVNHLTKLRAGERIQDVLFADLDFLLLHIEKQERK